MPTLACADRASWLEARRDGLGGSDAAAALGLSPYLTPLQLWAQKSQLAPDTPETERMVWGRLLEPLVAERYSQETHRALAAAEPYLLHIHPDIPWLRTTLDRLIVWADGKAVPAPLEMKTTGFVFEDQWMTEPPVHVQVQGQHQLLVTGYPWVSFAVLIGGQSFRWCDMPRNERFLVLLEERLKEFWRRVQLGDPPPPEAEDKQLLEALHPQEQAGLSVILPPESKEWDLRRRKILSDIRALRRECDEVDNYFREAIGEAEYGVLPNDMGRYAWRRIERKEYVSPATSYRELRRLYR